MRKMNNFLKVLNEIKTLSDEELIRFIYNNYFSNKEKYLFDFMFNGKHYTKEVMSTIFFTTSIYSKKKNIVFKTKMLYLILSDTERLKKEYIAFMNTIPRVWHDIYDSIFCNNYRKVFKKYNIKRKNYKYVLCDKLKHNKILYELASLILKHKWRLPPAKP
jgi:hypothetical protein